MVVTLGSGILISNLFSHMHGYPDATILARMYGYNNICLYVDFPPTTLVVPYLWGFICVLTAGWVAIAELRFKGAEEAGLLKLGA